MAAYSGRTRQMLRSAAFDQGHLAPPSPPDAEWGAQPVFTQEAIADYLASPLRGHRKYSFIKKLDKGTFGQVELAVDQTTGERVAVKFIPRTADVSKYVQREVSTHRRLCHPHIIQLKEVFLVNEHLALSMEYASGGTLYTLVSTQGGLAEVDARWYWQQLVLAVDYCHKRGVCNRDIKLENVLVTARDKPLIKLCDFGYSKDENYHSAAGSRVGTPAYIAPEVWQSTAPGITYDGKAADVWSLGVALYVLLFARYPFGRPEDTHTHKAHDLMQHRITLGDYCYPRGAQVSRELKDLIARILVVNPAERLTLAGIQQHPWFLADLPDGVASMNDHLLRSQGVLA